MKPRVSKALSRFLAAALMAALPFSADACSVCFGDPDSGAVKGTAWAIIFLGAVVLSVLGCVGGFFVFIARRASASPLAHADDAAPEN